MGTAPTPPTQNVGVLIRLFPTRFDLVPALLQLLAQDVKTMDLTNQVRYTAALFTVMAERGKNGNVFLVTVVET